MDMIVDFGWICIDGCIGIEIPIQMYTFYMLQYTANEVIASGLGLSCASIITGPP